jgi:hypothetical protein
MAKESQPPANIHWHDDTQRVLIIEYPPELHMDQVLDGIRRGFAMLDTVDHPVSVVYDFRVSGQPVDAFWGRLSEIAELKHPRIAQSILVGVGGLLQSVAEIYSNLFEPVRAFETMNEALTYIHRNTGVQPPEA